MVHWKNTEFVLGVIIISILYLKTTTADELEEGSGDVDPGDNNNNNDTSNLTTAEVAIICGAAVIVLVSFLAYVIYISCQGRRYNPTTLIRLDRAASQNDDSTLYMIDYDEVEINRGKLILNSENPNKHKSVA